jgi:hypothetical protein
MEKHTNILFRNIELRIVYNYTPPSQGNYDIEPIGEVIDIRKVYHNGEDIINLVDLYMDELEELVSREEEWERIENS